MDVADNQKLSGESVWYFPVGDSSQDPHVSIARFPSSESTSSSDPKYSPYSSLDSDESFTHRRLSTRKTAIAPRNLSPKRFDNYRWPSTDQPVRTVSRQRSSSVPPSASFGIASVEAEEGLVGDKLTELSSANQPFMDTNDSRMVEDFTLWSDEEQQKSETGYVKVRPTRTRFAPLTNLLCASRGIFLTRNFVWGKIVDCMPNLLVCLLDNSPTNQLAVNEVTHWLAHRQWIFYKQGRLHCLYTICVHLWNAHCTITIYLPKLYFEQLFTVIILSKMFY